MKLEQISLKIPLTLIKDYGLSPIAALIYGELSGLYFGSKDRRCDITDLTLSSRLNKSISSIQRGLKELKNSGLITSKQKPNFKGRNITVAKTAEKPFILIPISIIRRGYINSSALLVYGWLNSELQKQIKINEDKYYDEPYTDTIIVNKSKIAQDLNKSTRYIRKTMKELENYGYIFTNPIAGKGVEIIFRFVKNMPLRTQLPSQGMNKMSIGYEQNDKPPMNKMSIEVGTKRATNRIFNRVINKGIDKNQSPKNKDFLRSHTALDEFLEDPFLTPADLHSLSSPMYYDSLPDENNIPPELEKESYSDYEELNKHDSNQATSKQHQHKNNSRTAKSGSKEKGGKNLANTSPKHHQHKNDVETAKSDSNGKSNKDLTQTAPKPKELEPDKAFQSILRNITGKQYIITQNTKEALYQRLEQGYTLNDFETAISSLAKQGKQVSMLDLILHIGSYLDQ